MSVVALLTHGKQTSEGFPDSGKELAMNTLAIGIALLEMMPRALLSMREAMFGGA